MFKIECDSGELETIWTGFGRLEVFQVDSVGFKPLWRRLGQRNFQQQQQNPKASVQVADLDDFKHGLICILFYEFFFVFVFFFSIVQLRFILKVSVCLYVSYAMPSKETCRKFIRIRVMLTKEHKIQQQNTVIPSKTVLEAKQ